MWRVVTGTGCKGCRWAEKRCNVKNRRSRRFQRTECSNSSDAITGSTPQNTSYGSKQVLLRLDSTREDLNIRGVCGVGSPKTLIYWVFMVWDVPCRLSVKEQEGRQPTCLPFFFHPICYPRSTLALPPSSNSDPGSHSRSSSPLPTTVRAFIFYREKSLEFSSLVDSRPIAHGNKNTSTCSTCAGSQCFLNTCIAASHPMLEHMRCFIQHVQCFSVYFSSTHPSNEKTVRCYYLSTKCIASTHPSKPTQCPTRCIIQYGQYRIPGK